MCHGGLQCLEEKKNENMSKKRGRCNQTANAPPSQQGEFSCVMCERVCRSRIGLNSHMKVHFRNTEGGRKVFFFLCQCWNIVLQDSIVLVYTIDCITKLQEGYALSNKVRTQVFEPMWLITETRNNFVFCVLQNVHVYKLGTLGGGFLLS